MMKIQHILLVNIVTFSGIFSMGLGMPVDAETATIEKPRTAIELKSVEVEKTPRKLKTNTVKTKKKRASTSGNSQANDADESQISVNNELKKPLDLSIPYKSLKNVGLKITQNRPAERSESTNIFAKETNNKSPPLQLNGKFLMSPEPEAEKRKSVDGAGIVINIKP